MNWPLNTIVMQAERPPAKSGAERASDKRERWRFRWKLAEALIETKRLGEWDADDRLAIDRARDLLLQDYIVAVLGDTSDSKDPVPRAMTNTADELTSHERE